jgi:hypothetical protein
MGCDIHMYIEYKCGNGLPWQADDHHFPKWDSRCVDSKLDKAAWCQSCQQGSETRCDSGYIDFKPVRAVCRDYRMFAQIASVRGQGPRQALGLPDDVSEVISKASDVYGVDGHSHSFLPLDEYKKVLFEELRYEPTNRSDAFYERSLPYKDQPPYYTTLVNYCEKLKDEKSLDKQILGKDTSSEVQVRLVFWFDN